MNGNPDSNDLKKRRQVKTGLNIRYNFTSKLIDLGEENVFGVWQSDYYVLYCVTRVATKQYSYVGLTESTAKTLASSKTTDYTRSKKGWYLSDTSIQYVNETYCGADIHPSHTSGCMWQVDLNVNERDDMWVIPPKDSQGQQGHLNPDLSTYFSYIPSGWDYDED